MNPSNSSNSSNPINFLTVDLEDYFQVHAFSNVIRYEDWDNYESRIEKNTHRLLEILNDCVGPNNSMNSTNLSRLPCNEYVRGEMRSLFHWDSSNSMNPSNSINSNNPTSDLKPQGLDLTPCSMPSALCRPVQATFFILGWLAERYPHLIRTIREEGHEIACHGYAHKLIYTQTKEEFREDIRKAKAILEDLTGGEVIGYRAPSYSITQKSKWALEILMEEGFKYDSSIFPIHHDFYGFPQSPRFPFLISMNGNNNFEFSLLNFDLQEPQFSVNSTNSMNPSNPSNPSNSSNSPCSMPHASSIVEFPISTVRILGVNLPMGGGGYFRLFPYPIIKKGLTRINRIEEMPFIFYLHPWELDDEQPRINGIGLRSRFRHYNNLRNTESKFKKLLSDFNFSSIKEITELNNSINPSNPSNPINPRVTY